MLSETQRGPQDLWEEFLVTQAGSLSPYVLETWLKPVLCAQFDGHTATLQVRDQFFRDWLQDHYLDIIREGLGRVAGCPVLIAWEINPELHARSAAEERSKAASEAPAENEAESESEEAARSQRRRSRKGHLAAVEQSTPELATRERKSGARESKARLERFSLPPLNARYRFDSYVCGPSNHFAFAACRAAADNPGRAYNPLFIFGGVGLGKTHLLTAIGHQILSERPDARIVYTSSEQFTNEVINAVLGARLDKFRAKYRDGCDVILMDDIQLIAGKERTQHEFFHIFNTLHDSQRQIVVASDKLPHEIPDIEERLRNRFQWGLIADIQPPEIETRIAILRKKAEAEGVELPNDVAFFLARNIRSNVRELEGALVRVMAHASLSNTTLSMDYVRKALGDVVQGQIQELSIDTIQRLVGSYFQVRVTDIKGKRRLKELVRPRQLAMFLCRKHLGLSYPELGSRFGNKDHTTVMSACLRIEEALPNDANMREQLEDLERRMERAQQSD